MLKARITLAASALALLSLTGCASKTQSVSASDLLFHSLAGGQHLVWEYERVSLSAQQASSLSAAASGDSLKLAAKIVEQRVSASPLPASNPVALTCGNPNLVVITSEALTSKYVERGCTIVRQV
ncbi:hypothetical protein [Pseudomonas sp. GXZC]|uniref:hypothetical protein n=1 Tax=Pseudomonas sp. GXZC TaxID=3003351 RepID=UPI0022AB1CC7|nr:hypothetical protein [Pseudomonas sp. GXZC]WAT32237.1 hypothetical protein OZ428_33715 [Pseudomonas sp. GXZC]